MLSEQAWNSVNRRFGPHSFDLMALDSNCRRDRSGLMLPHYSPWPTPASEEVNAFAQPIPLEHNIYAFPPFVLLGPLLRYFLDQGFHGALTLVVPDLRPRRFWWALLQSVAVDSLLLGRKGDDAVLLFASRSTYVWSARFLQWDLWGLSLYFLIFSLLRSARFRDLGNQPVFVVRVCIRMTQMPISVKHVGFPLCPWCQLFPVQGSCG